MRTSTELSQLCSRLLHKFGQQPAAQFVQQAIGQFGQRSADSFLPSIKGLEAELASEPLPETPKLAGDA